MSNKITLTEEQKDIFYYIDKRHENLYIKAYAGSGKTFIVTNGSRLIPKEKSSTFLAFNKHIKEELAEKLPQHIRVNTSHGAGLAALKRKYPNIEFDEFKVDKIIKKKSKSWGLGKEFKNRFEEEQYFKELKKLVNLSRLTLTLDKKYIGFLAEKHDVKVTDKDIKRVGSIMEFIINDRTSFDFTDMVFLPAVDNKIWFFPQDFVIVDEFQDISRAQQKIIEKMIKKNRVTGKYEGRLIVVGDDLQCQPKGTKVFLSDGTQKNIEDIVVGDVVVSYNRSEKGQFVGNYESLLKRQKNGLYDYQKQHAPIITGVAKRKFSGELIKITSNNLSSIYTPDHIAIAKFRENSLKKYVLYLMEKDGYFRIGIVRLWSKHTNHFLGMRAIQENADKLWVLNTYHDRYSAYIDEQYYSLIYSIPQIIFTYREQKGNIKQDDINNFYNRLDKNILNNNSLRLLKKFKREYDFPIWEKGVAKYFSKLHLFEIRACNILPDVMDVIIYDKNNKAKRTHGITKKSDNIIRPTYKPIDKLEYVLYDDYVYSLQVNKYQLYVADGILTHNCLYGFVGVSEKSLEWFQNFPNMKTLPLSYTFRCSKNVVKEAQKIVPEIKALPDAPDGIVREGSVLDEAKDGDFVLCRTTEPLIRLFFQLLERGKTAYIKGSDIGIEIIGMVDNFDNLGVAMTYWENRLTTLSSNLKQSGVIDPKEDSGYVALNDKYMVLSFLSKFSNSIKDLIEKIHVLFGDNKKEGIVLSTVHKSKGLEADRVFIIKPKLLPMKVAKAWQYQQELNLKYVAVTRAKLELIYDNEWDSENDK